MAGIASGDGNMAGWDAFMHKVFGRSNYLGDVAGDSRTALAAGSPGDWQTQGVGTASTVKFINRDGSVCTLTDTLGQALAIAVGAKLSRL